MAAEPSGRRGRLLLATGALVGAAVAGFGALPGSSNGAGADLPPEVVAMVNGVPISEERYRLALAALEADRRDPLSEADRQRVLDTLIDEELLVQRGLEIGLAETDPGVRSSLTTAMVQWAGRDREAPPDEASLRAHYESNRDAFTRPGRLRVRRMVFVRRDPQDQPELRAERARRELAAGGAWASVRAELADSPIAPVPDALLPVTTLREYLGPSLTRAAEQLAVQEVSKPLEGPGGLHLLEVLEVRDAIVPPFEAVREAVLFESRRRHDEAALRAYVHMLRDRAQLVIRPP